jgi:uncharacterized protein
MTQNIVTGVEPKLTQIVIYPVKSLDGMVVDRSQISTGGALAFDRRWAIVDAGDRVVNGKRTAKIQQLRSQFELVHEGLELERRSLIHLQTGDDASIYTFCLNTELTKLSQWLSQFFGFSVSLIEDTTTGFPDDLNAYGPTIVSTATLETICTWFPALDLAEVRRRFRPNLELSGVPAFWEDRLFGASETAIDFQLGNVQFCGINPCQRCIVPTRNSFTGAITAKFQQIFIQHRQQTLPVEVNAGRFNHFYRLAVNTQIPLTEAGKFLNTGDRLTISSESDL